VKSAVPISGARVFKLTAEKGVEGFFAGIYASKRLNTVGRNLLTPAVG